MRCCKFLGLVFFSCILFFSHKTYTEELLAKQYIFPLQDKHVHGSSIVQLPNGDLLAVWFHGSGERTANDVILQGSRLKTGSDSWGPIFLMAETHNTPDCNPVLFLDSDHRLWLYWIAVNANRWEQSILKYRYTDNWAGEGAPEWEWQDVLLLKPGASFADEIEEGFDTLQYAEPLWAEYAPRYTRMLIEAAKDPVKRDIGWMTRTALVTLDNGRILLPLYSDGYNVSLVAYSDDKGASWQCSAPIVGLGNIQPSLAVRSNGEIVAFMRDNGPSPKRIQEATSDDDGETWSVARPIELNNPGSSVAVEVLRSGHWVLVYNDAEQGRHNMAVALSEDEGETWSYHRYLEKEESGEQSFGYPFIIEDAEGVIHVTYSYRGSDGASITHTKFTPDWIRGK